MTKSRCVSGTSEAAPNRSAVRRHSPSDRAKRAIRMGAGKRLKRARDSRSYRSARFRPKYTLRVKSSLRSLERARWISSCTSAEVARIWGASCSAWVVATDGRGRWPRAAARRET